MAEGERCGKRGMMRLIWVVELLMVSATGKDIFESVSPKSALLHAYRSPAHLLYSYLSLYSH